jgi:hypothetical protein
LSALGAGGRLAAAVTTHRPVRAARHLKEDAGFHSRLIVMTPNPLQSIPAAQRVKTIFTTFK